MVNEQLDAQMNEIKQRIVLSMNGVTSDSMKEKGVNYKINYGVSLPTLREIAALYTPSVDLSNRLWLLGWRETLILSILLQPVASVTAEKVLERVKATSEKEIIDAMCLFLLSKLSFRSQLPAILLAENDRNCNVAAFMLSARIYQQLNATAVDLIIENGIKMSESDDYELYKSIAICFGRLCRINNQRAEQLKELADGFLSAQISSQQVIATEVKQELDFLIDL